MTEQAWFVAERAGGRVRVEWVGEETRLLISRRLRRELERRVAGLGDVVKSARAFFANTNISYGFLDIVIGVGEVRGREGSFHLMVPSMPCESAWIEFRLDSAEIDGEPIQETLAEVVDLGEELSCSDENNYYAGASDK